MNLDELVKHLIKSEKGKLLLLGIARMEDQESLMYLDEFKEDQDTKQEYQILRFFAQQGILSENHSTSERGGSYSVFRMTEKGRQYFQRLNSRP